MSRRSITKVVLCFLLIIINGCTPALSSQSLAESDHPYANDIDKKWTVSEPGASEIRLHFKDLQLAKYDSDGYDKVLILDRFDNVVETYGGYSGVNSQDFWTDWYKGDKLTIELVTDKTRPCYGFVVDQKDFKIDGNSSENVDPNSPKTVAPTEIQPNVTDKILTTTTLNSSANSFTSGQSVKLIAKVDKRYQFDTSSEEAEEPSGTVNFMDETTFIGSGKVVSGQATLTTSALPVSSHSITAKYIGDINFKSSTSPASTITVIDSVPEQQLSNETSNSSVTPILPTVTPTNQKEETHSILSSLITILTSLKNFLSSFIGFITSLATIAGTYIAYKGYIASKK
jgi:hypothetical protein